MLYREGSDDPLTVASAHAEGPGWIVVFREVRTREAAEPLMNAYLATELAREAALEPGAFYWHDVIGAKVSDVGGAELGKVHDIYRVGGAEVFVVTGGPFGSFDLPVVGAFIRTFDPTGAGVVIDAEAIGLELTRAPKERKVGPRVRRAQRKAGSAPEASAEGATEGSGEGSAEPKADDEG